MNKNADRQKLTQYKNEKSFKQFQYIHLAERLRPKKQLGQNFLVDQNIVRNIIAACHLQKEDVVLEIGPGLGAMTPHIAQHVQKIIAIETDSRYYTELRNRLTQNIKFCKRNVIPVPAVCHSRESGNLNAAFRAVMPAFAGMTQINIISTNVNNIELINADFLEFDVTSLPRNLKVIANLPYNICSVIIARLLENKRHFHSLYFTVQLEFGKRMVARPNTKDYSAFSILTQYHTKPRILFKIKRTAFRPQPKVDSCFVALDILAQPTYPAANELLLFDIVRYAFRQRRKILINALEEIINKNELYFILKQLNLEKNVRAEDLSIADFVGMANLIKA